MARSATPFNWWTWGGQVEECLPRSERRSVNSRERNSPALSLCKVPTMRVRRSAVFIRQGCEGGDELTH
eukprot:4565805-Pleurochrysis_carterae.AAC.1